MLSRVALYIERYGNNGNELKSVDQSDDECIFVMFKLRVDPFKKKLQV